MTVQIIIGDALESLRALPSDSVDCCVTSPPYWGLRDYGVDGQLGIEPTLAEHIAAMVAVFEEVRRVLTPSGTCWINYGDCYATKPNGRSAADTKLLGSDDRTFRDKPFSTVGPIHPPEPGQPFPAGIGRRGGGNAPCTGLLKPKDLCMVPNRLAIALQDAGWWVRSEIIWGKPNPMPDSSGRYRPSTAHEKVFLLTKSAKSHYDNEAVKMPASEAPPKSRAATPIDGKQDRIAAASAGSSSIRQMAGFNERWNSGEHDRDGKRLLRNYEPDLSAIVPLEVWEIATAAFSEAHFATFPPALVAPCIMAGCPVGGTVLDPFFGAGTTGLVADRLQRDCIGIELNPEYAALAQNRIDGDRGGLLDAMECAA